MTRKKTKKKKAVKKKGKTKAKKKTTKKKGRPGHKHAWKQASNAKHTFTCQRCGMKRTMKKVKSPGRFGFKFEITFCMPGGKKVKIDRQHNYKTPVCKPKAKAA